MKAGEVVVRGLLFLGLAMQLQAASWPSFRHNAKRTGFTAEQAAPPLTLRWRYMPEGAILSSPAVAYGKVYVGSRARTLDALDAFTGELVWSYRAQGWIDSSPAVADGRVFVASRDGTLHAVDAATGQGLWTYGTDSTDLASPAVANGEVFMVTGYPSKLLLVLDAKTGALRRSASLPSFSNSSPSVDVEGGRVTVGSNDGKYTAFNLASLAQLWQVQSLGGVYYSTLARAPGVVISLPGNDDRSAHGFDPGSGAEVWVSANLAAGPAFVGSPAVAGGTVVAAVGCQPHCLFGLDAANGSLKWGGVSVGDAPTLGFASSPAVADETVYVGGGDGRLYAIGLATGGVLAAANLGSSVLSSPAVANGWVYIGTLNGQLFAFQAGRVNAIASPDPNLEPQVFGIVPLKGYVLAPDLASYKVEFGSGTSPASWTFLAESTAPADGTLLANWDTSSLAPGPYSVRVSALSGPPASLVSVTTAAFAVTQSSSVEVSAARGGTVSLPDGTELVIPAGALARDSSLTVTRVLTGYPDSGIPAEARATSVVREVTLAGEAHPTFAIPVTLRVPYALADLPPGSVEKNLRLYFFDEALGQWRMVNSSVARPEEKKVEAALDHLTLFRVMAYVPGSGDLVQAFYSTPNPARGDSVTFKFLLSEDADVRIRVYNVAGEPVADLRRAGNPAGVVSAVTWSMGRTASGVYLYLLEAKSAGRSAVVKKWMSIVH